MVPFDFELRTRVVFGHRSFTRLGHLPREINFRRTLLVADRGLVTAGRIGEALRFLAEARIEAVPFHDFAPNPDSALVDAGCRFAERWRLIPSSRSAGAARFIAPRGSISY